ncbi:hypothetical protein [Companilactobacillus sp. DQM5]|uniref:hypothetical protein n=1 Tax=Companilactobacillus sp. DQM5 TaxID=3463359 RepID=UPI0040598D83
MNNKKIIYAAGVALLLAQAATPIINVTAISNDSQRTVIPTNFPKGNFQGDFTVDAQNTTVNAGQSANFNIYLKSTGAVTNLSNVDLKVQLPKQDYVEFSQSLDALKLNNVVPKYDKTSGLLTWHFDKLPTGQVNKTVLRLDTINGGFTNQTPIKISGTLTADSDKGAIKAQTGGQTVVNATKNLSLINKFQSIYNNDVSSETYHTNPVIGDEILWNVGIGAPKK